MALPELDKLIVTHLADIDASAKRVCAIEDELFGAMDATAKEWAKTKGWIGEHEYLKKRLWLASPEWQRSGTAPSANRLDAWFHLKLGAGDTGRPGSPAEDHFQLTRLCRVGSGEIGFIFEQDLIGRAAWRRQFKGLCELVEKTAFEPDDEQSFFLPVRLDLEMLAESLGQKSIEDSLGPFTEALAKIGEARSAFDNVIAAIRPDGRTAEVAE